MQQHEIICCFWERCFAYPAGRLHCVVRRLLSRLCCTYCCSVIAMIPCSHNVILIPNPHAFSRSNEVENRVSSMQDAISLPFLHRWSFMQLSHSGREAGKGRVGTERSVGKRNLVAGELSRDATSIHSMLTSPHPSFSHRRPNARRTIPGNGEACSRKQEAPFGLTSLFLMQVVGGFCCVETQRLFSSRGDVHGDLGISCEGDGEKGP